LRRGAKKRNIFICSGEGCTNSAVQGGVANVTVQKSLGKFAEVNGANTIQ
jgi:hypothetical protein